MADTAALQPVGDPGSVLPIRTRLDATSAQPPVGGSYLPTSATSLPIVRHDRASGRVRDGVGLFRDPGEAEDYVPRIPFAR